MLVVTVLVLGLGLAACAEDGGDGGSAAVEQSEEFRAADGADDALSADRAALGSAAGGTGGGSAASRSVTGNVPDIGPSVIKTARLEVEVAKDSFRDAIQEGIAAAERYGGFVVQTSIDDEARGVGTIVIRVPAERFGDALSDIEDLGDVQNETVSGRDVGQEFVDLQARLRNFTAQEAVLLRLMARAETVVDTIRVQSELQIVQLEIERLRGRIRFLEDQTSLGTIEVRVIEAGVVPNEVGEIGRAWERAKDGFIAVVAGLITSLGVIVPLAILIALIVLVVTRLRPRLTS